MSLDERYRLLALEGNEGAQTFAAQEISTGKRVTVFLFVGEQAREQSDFLIQLGATGRDQFPELIETGDNRGTPYVVSEPIDSLTEFKRRLSRVTTPPQEEPVQKAGQFSKAGVWQVPANLQPPESQEKAAQSSRDTNAGGPRETAKTSSNKAPGLFTQMFQAAAPAGEPAIQPQKAPEPEPPVSESPGSFAQMFQSAGVPIGESVPQPSKTAMKPSPSKPAESGPGEFTRFFNAAASPSRAPSPVPSKRESAGDFERIFGSGDSAAANPPVGTGIFGQSNPAAETPAVETQQSQSTPAQASPPPGEFTGIFNAATSGVPATGPKASPPPAGGPGDYTRMFGAQSFSQEPPAEPAKAPAITPEVPAPVKINPKMVFALIGIALLLLAAITVVVVTMGK